MISGLYSACYFKLFVYNPEQMRPEKHRSEDSKKILEPKENVSLLLRGAVQF
jgi:hypothetical protein